MDAQHHTKLLIDRLEETYQADYDVHEGPNFNHVDMALLTIIKKQQIQIEELAARIYMLERAEQDNKYFDDTGIVNEIYKYGK